MSRWKDCYCINPSTKQWSFWALQQSLPPFYWHDSLFWIHFNGKGGTTIISSTMHVKSTFLSPCLTLLNSSFSMEKRTKKLNLISMHQTNCFQIIMKCLHVISMQFFASNGFPCPTLRNPSDHYLRTINKDFDAVSIYIYIYFFFFSLPSLPMNIIIMAMGYTNCLKLMSTLCFWTLGHHTRPWWYNKLWGSH